MHILIFSDNFPPEVNAAAHRIFERARYWAHWGHQVSVITSAPNFPQGRVYPGYKNKWHQVENREGIRVIRVKTFMAPNRGFFLRTLDFISFMLMATFVGSWQKKPDIIIASTPQLFTAVAGWIVAKIKRTYLLLEISDLWPASIVAVGALKNKKILRALEKMELFLYHQANLIITLTHRFKANLVKRGIASKKINVVINGVDLIKFSPREKNQSLLQKYGLTHKFIIGYIGTQGLAHNLISVLQTAKELTAYTHIHFLFVGDGAESEKLHAFADKNQITNITFLPQQPRELITEFWSVCDVALIHLKNHPTFAEVIPSKLFEAIGMTVPIVACLPKGEASDMIERDGLGICCESHHLQMTLLQLVKNAELLSQIKENARRHREKYNREKQAALYLEVLSTLFAVGKARQSGET